ncbi:mandelate racemase/muconate lactonizing enzyme family protein [Lignipirellula cremea]|uniref:Enolase C-terminal domain-containing protein n=1 Tax=Lignipirellula cremea TaxID=2528010 RepID=A0A518E2B1_9BACT|nr:mandelate racemase/muconate lactonizing enzyme family protein [Lignipirellula cremea]QDU98235.1 hypothetical protein Pla8534_60960 [Lignipirellula cremea]
MSKPTDIFIKNVASQSERYAYRTPIKFGGRVVNEAVVVNVTVDVETRDGRTATGWGSMPIGNAWAWPSQQLSSEQTFAAMHALADKLAADAGQYNEAGHPLEITHDLAARYEAAGAEVCADLPETMPKLAQLVSASPLEAAIHDAYGRALSTSSYSVLGKEHCNRDLSAWLNDDFAGEYLHDYTLPIIKPTLPLYHLIGALDPIVAGDISQPINDGLPETLAQWIHADGLTHLKIKLAGDDLQWDLDRVVAIDNEAAVAQQQRGCDSWFYSLDFNEKCENVEYVLEFLRRLQERQPTALARTQYIEQPTHRDLKANPENRMHEAAKIKPVVIDESLIDFESLLLAREQGYSGVALKACKGHSEALLMGAAAQKYGMFLCVQDLTCIGASFLHSASLAARTPGVAAIEGNGRQYCPAGNAAWTEAYPGMFEISAGFVATGQLNGPGLGFGPPA